MLNRVVVTVEPDNGEQGPKNDATRLSSLNSAPRHFSDYTLCTMRISDIAVSVGATWTDHYLLQATVPFRTVGGGGALVLYVGHPDLTKEKPLNHGAMKLLRYLQDVCTILPSIEIRGRAILCAETGDITVETLSLIQRIIATKKERQLPPEVDQWIEERELRDVSNFPPALRDMHQLLLPRRERYGTIVV